MKVLQACVSFSVQNFRQGSLDPRAEMVTYDSEIEWK